MAVSKARMKATEKYNAKAYDRTYLRTKKEGDLTIDVIKQAADDSGESLNTFILEAVRRRIEQGN